MKTVHCFRLAAVLALSLVTSDVVHADAAKSAKTIAPYLDEGTIAVGRIDLTKVDVSEIFKTLVKYNPLGPRTVKQSQRAASQLVTKLREQKVAEGFVVVSLSDLPRSPPFLIVPVGDGGSHRRVAELLSFKGERGPFEVCTQLGNVVFCGSTKTLARLKDIKPSSRPNLASAFAAVEGAAVQFAFVPSKDHHRVLAEMMPKLPPNFGGLTGTELSKAVRWAALGVHLPPKLKANLVVLFCGIPFNQFLH